jgi:hypothetical protein
VDSHEGITGLYLLGLEGLRYTISQAAAPPAAPDVTKSVRLGGVTFRVVGPDYIVGNRHFTVVLRRQGGIIREIRAGAERLVWDQDLYGDQAFMRTRNEAIRAVNDVECGQTYVPAGEGLHVIFEGQLRGMDRFALKRPPVWYRNEYVFADTSRFTQKWAFRTERSVQNQPALLAWFVTLLEACRLDGGDERRGVPDKIVLSRQGTTQLTLEQIQLPAGSNCAVAGNSLILSLVDSQLASIEEGKWHESQVDWVLRR